MLAAPPTGTVTFLFTDIQGSTKLWEQNPDAMRPALARHDHLLRRSIETHQGYVFKTGGDSFCAAFPNASQALDAALAAQTALAAEAWETAEWRLPAPIQVRMALHTGSAEERGGDYFGPPVNRTARLMAAGHGGQTLLSGAALAAVQDALPPSASLLDLGRHRLKDLGQPEHVHQIIYPALPADFPPLRSLGSPSLPNNLPQQTTSFIEREQEVRAVKTLLLQSRLLTLTGAGGSGKTRLSLQVAADLLNGDGDGVWLVELGALFDPALVPQAVADVLGVKETPETPLAQTLAKWLKEKRLLLILDNCEHLVSACASLADALLRSCPGVHLLTSSREALNVPGEQVYRVPTLSVPDPKQTYTPPALLPFESVRLFTERAKTVQPSFAVTDANAADVAAICVRLDGIPLAIELAAARVRSLPVEQINTRLDQRFRLLTGGSRTALPRQQTLRALVDWSYDLLTQNEKTLLCRLSVFAGGWTLEAAEAVCSGGSIEAWEVLDLLTSLVNKSLVAYDETEDGAGRDRLLETVRHYAADLLAASGETEDVQARAASWFLALAEEAEPELRGPEQGVWLSRLEAEHGNLRASLSWYEHQENAIEAGLRLTGALWRLWFIGGHFFEGRQWLDRVLARANGQIEKAGSAPGAWAKALNGAGNLANIQGDYAAARATHEQGLALKRRMGDQVGIANTLNNLGMVASAEGRYAQAQSLHEECLPLYREAGDQAGVANALNNLGNAVRAQGRDAEAQALYEESLTLQRILGDQYGIANTLNNLGLIAHAASAHAEALALYEKSLFIRRQLGDRRGIASSLNNLGSVARSQENLAGAQALFEESLSIRRQLGDQRGIADLLVGLGSVARGQNQQARAARLLGAAASLRETIGTSLNPVDQQEADKQAAQVREALGPNAFAAEWDIGRAMTLDQAVEHALSAEDSDLKPL